ncbi:hypothetical protein RJ639_017145 [Escallonia herrerae]|uniref:Reverse transcriptase Ty1/copia-type domain-containing protein n=1 Tax=Escallonia herrerae TaxID=1293975 RepID=A0AA88VBR2_9ASTE|nr:hypothetical protein RJ639_017145 [Escallonia herrerae]
MEDESASYVHGGLAPVANVQNIAIDTKSPFYLHPSDHPGLIFVTQPLSENGENYFTWRRNMLTALQSKNKAGHCKIWCDFDERFTQGIALIVYDLKRSIALLQQEKSAISTYYGKLKGVWNELHNLRPIPVCTYGAGKKMQEMREEEKVFDFLMGLDDTYKTVRSQILSIDPLPGLGRAYVVAAQEEKQQVVAAARVPTIEATTLLAKAPHMRHGGDQKIDRRGENSGERRHGGLHCTQCNRSNHSRENCYEIIRYPPGWRRPKLRGGNQPWLRASGGTASSTAIAQPFAATADASAPFPNHSAAYQTWSRTAGDTVPETRVSQQFVPTSDESVSFPSFTPSEMQRLADLLGRQSGATNGPSANMTSQNISGKPDSWIIDIGATDHISCKLDTMPDAYTNPGVPPIQIPNGDTVPVHALGRVNLGPNLHLEQKGYRIYDLESKVIYSSRDVQFFESIFPFADKKDNIADLQACHTPFGLTDHLPVDWECQAASHAPTGETSKSTQTSDVPTRSNSPHNVDLEPLSLGSSLSQDQIPLDQAPGSAELTPSTIQSPIRTEQSALPVNEPLVVPSKSTRQVSKNLFGYNYTLPPSLAPPSSSSHSSSLSANSTVYPLSHNISYSKFSRTHTAFLAAISFVDEPKYFSQAVKHAHWRDAMAKEISALEANNTWTLMPLPSGKRAIDSKWVYKVKFHPDGTVERYKARLVAKGYNQIEGLDFHETFAPVAKLVTVRCLLAIASIKKWELHQLDVNNAFLHGDLEEEVYMKIPQGSFLAVLIYVDDVLVTGTDSAKISWLKHYLDTKFHIKDLGKLKYFLGIEVAHSSDGIVLSQRKYVLDILTECGLTGCKPSSSPMAEQHQLIINSGELCDDPGQYRRLIGRLLYLTITLPDISYVVHILSQFMHKPRRPHYDAAIRVLRYLKNSPGQGILLSSNSSLSLRAYCDVDWAGCPTTRKSTTGYIVFLGSSPISWRSKKQSIVSCSTTEAEYRAMATTASEIIWLLRLLSDLGVSHQNPVSLFCDNQAALHIVANPVFHERTKHIEIDCHFVQHHTQSKALLPRPISSQYQLANIFTKALGQERFHILLGKLGISNIHAPT